MIGLRIGAVGALALALAACSSTVVRDAGAGGRATAGRPASGAKVGATTLVKRGDTLYRIASSNGIAVWDLAAWNSIPMPYTIYPGQRLRLYPANAGSTRTARTTPKPPVRSGRTGNPTATVVPRTATMPAPIDPIASGVQWRWPADGTLLSRYAAGEPTKQGIDIGGTGGAAVRAAGDGVVVYSGSGLVGYGELIIIKHNDSWLSAYGHNRSRMVNEGELVKVGQQIAVMGRSGAPRDMLHFEVRYNGKPVDPLRYLPPR